MPLFKRHKVLLGAILKAPRCPTRMELMKWLFLLKQETSLDSDPTFYDFVPYKYGPFSFTVYRDLDELSRFGFFADEELRIRPSLLSDANREFLSLPNAIRSAISSILTQYGCISLRRLIDSIYDRYPWFASRSESKKIQSSSKRPRKFAAFTAGYEGKSIDAFLQKLMAAGIERIIDVRNNPISRKYGFSKEVLNRLSSRVDIEYVHIPDLGVPPSFRRSLDTFDDYLDLMSYYESSILPSVPSFRRRAARLLKERPSVLVCFEADSNYCHRARLAKVLSSDTGLEVVHL